MARIVAFKQKAGRSKLSAPLGHSAEILFFTGVRYERQPAAPSAPAPRSRKAAKPRDEIRVPA